ncbi:MAG TPA: DUF6782 family putative metallopeptidase [Blastocatellia bacterium]|jgi:type VI secretion system secreted protein VgrG|nr:DUF6782 family putative metallopeptidase [Blastocatellia bacterium]
MGLLESLQKTAQSAVDLAVAVFSNQAPSPVVKCPAPRPAPKKTNPTTGLGNSVDKIIGKSPKFTKKIKDLQADGWKIQYGAAGKGTYVDKKAKTIVIDSNQKKNANEAVTSLAHEAGHAGYNNKYTPPTGLKKEEYVKANVKDNLADEGEATLTNIELKRDLKANGGPDITVAGAHAGEYEKIYDKYPDPKDRQKARDEIGDTFATKERPSTAPDKTYNEYYSKTYEDFYDKNVTGKSGGAKK